MLFLASKLISSGFKGDHMNDKKLYKIGEAAKLLNVSTKTLRFYDKVGIIKPDVVCEKGYRCYYYDTLLLMPVVQYYKQMGFSLAQMKSVINGGSYNGIKTLFREKIEELKIEQEEWYIKDKSVKDWKALIDEAVVVLENNHTEPSVKFKKERTYVFQEQPFYNNTISKVINIEFTKYIQSINNAITGAVMVMFPNSTNRIDGTGGSIIMLQEAILPLDDTYAKTIGGNLYISCYHVGGHKSIKNTYYKIFNYATSHNFKASEASIERYVVDYWTTKNKDLFVTEVLVEVYR